MLIKFRQPQDINAIRFGATLVWGAINGVITTIQGTSPLALVNAVAGRIKSLVQYGKCTTVDDEIYCNNGKLVVVDDELPAEYQRQVGFKFAASTYYHILDFHLRGTDTVRISFSVDKACNVFGCYTTNSATDNYSLYASTSSSAKYLRYDGATYNSYIPSAQVGERIDAVITPNGTSGMPTDSVITPAEFEATADLCIGTTSTSASSSKLDGNIWGNFVVDGRLTLIPCKRLSDDALGYYDLDSDVFYEPVVSAPTSIGVDTSHLTVLSVVGNPEVLTVGEQTATVENLLAVDDIKDEQNIISGTVTRRCEAVISDGTTPSGRYIGEVGEGNIIVKVRETGYEGDVATFEADRAEPLNGLTVNVEPIQAGSGDPSPDNVRPISGRTSATVTRTGKNLLSTNSFELAKPDRRTKDIPIDTIPAGTYRMSWVSANSTETRIQFFNNASGSSIAGNVATTNTGNKSVTLTEEANRMYVYILSTEPDGATAEISNIQIEVNDEATVYEPYQGDTYTITLGDTVYGGTLDVTQGKMVVTHMLFNRNSATMNNSNEYPGWNDAGLKALGYTGSRSGINTLLNIGSEFSYNCNGNNDILFFGAFVYHKTQEEWKALALDIQIVIPLVTPIEITLTPTQIDMLLGENNLWSDAGTVKAYVADGDVIEHVTAQPLRTVEGSNTVSVTSAVAPVQLEIDYYKDE